MRRSMRFVPRSNLFLPRGAVRVSVSVIGGCQQHSYHRPLSTAVLALPMLRDTLSAPARQTAANTFTAVYAELEIRNAARFIIVACVETAASGSGSATLNGRLHVFVLCFSQSLAFSLAVNIFFSPCALTF